MNFSALISEAAVRRKDRVIMTTVNVMQPAEATHAHVRVQSRGLIVTQPTGKQYVDGFSMMCAGLFVVMWTHFRSIFRTLFWLCGKILPLKQ